MGGRYCPKKTQRLEQAEQERRDKEQTKKLADEQAKQEQTKQAEQRKQLMINTFENLTTEQQEQILDEVSKFYQNTIFEKWFNEAKQGTAHKHPAFMIKFYELFGI